jgi:peptidoglycan/xylan/chitin deacetylase (PgdA/CDA1 family)
MKLILTSLVLTVVWCLGLRTLASPPDAAPERRIAITIDDLPANGANWMTAAQITTMTRSLVGTLREQKVPAVGFANERKLYFVWGEVDERIAALNMWLDAGLDLGNHSYGHTSINRGLKEFEDSVIQGESVTRLLLAQHNMKLRYFRHPYLDTGRDLETRRASEAFLAERGYRIAPVTLDAWDWMFAIVYDDAKKRGDAALQQQVVKSYLAYTTEVFSFDEKFSRDLIGHEPAQILLLHASQLEGEHIGELLELIRNRGYKFVTLEEALSDPAYSLPDTFVSDGGANWLEHWAVTRGVTVKNEPHAPKDMVDRANAIPHPQP